MVRSPRSGVPHGVRYREASGSVYLICAAMTLSGNNQVLRINVQCGVGMRADGIEDVDAKYN